MGKPWRLTIEDGAGVVFSFDHEGDFLPRLVAEYKDGANPPQVTALREVWEIKNATLSSATDVTAVWAAFFTFVDKIDRTNMPTKALMTSDPSGTPSVVRTLGPSTHERFKIEAAEVVKGPSDQVGDDQRKLLHVSVTISAVQRFADTNGICEWNQRVALSDAGGGLQRVTYTTELSTLEGTDAVAKAVAYAYIDISALGSYYTLETNTTNLVNTETLDDDKVNSRVPTRVVATSVAREWGVPSGSGTAQRPNEIALEIRTETTPEGETTTTMARAKGPGYLAWVESQAPTAYTSRERFVRHQDREAVYTWVRKITPIGQTGWIIDAFLSGGAQVQKWLPVCGGFEALLVEGAFLPWTLRVDVTVEQRGNDLRNKDLLLPAKLGDPWIFDPNESDEGQAAIAEPALVVSTGGDLYRRRAKLVYRSASKPTKSVADALATGAGVESYYGVP